MGLFSWRRKSKKPKSPPLKSPRRRNLTRSASLDRSGRLARRVFGSANKKSLSVAEKRSIDASALYDETLGPLDLYALEDNYDEYNYPIVRHAKPPLHPNKPMASRRKPAASRR